MERSGLKKIKISGPAGSFDFFFRPGSRGDRGVVRQVFSQKDYDLSPFPQSESSDRFLKQVVAEGSPLIIDAGANIGASTMYFLQAFPGATVIAIEPHPENFQLLRMNTEHVNGVLLFEGGIDRNGNTLKISNPEAEDWGFRTEITSRKASDSTSSLEKSIQGISPEQILSMREISGSVPFLAKFDIEGAEADLFSPPLDWLDKFAILGKL